MRFIPIIHPRHGMECPENIEGLLFICIAFKWNWYQDDWYAHNYITISFIYNMQKSNYILLQNIHLNFPDLPWKIVTKIRGGLVLELIIAFRKAVGFKCLLSHQIYLLSTFNI